MVILAGLFGSVIGAVLQSADVLPGEIEAALRPALALSVEPAPAAERLDGGIDIVHVDGPATGSAAGMLIGLAGLVLGGIPMALVGTVLASYARRRPRTWSAAWSHVFRGGLVFQLSSLGVTSLLLLGLLVVADIHSVTPGEVTYAGALLMNIGCSAVALRSWHTLRLSVSERPLSLVG